ncbi:hypothetical protein GB2A_gp091c [Caulobacter phage GB2A]|nr:hypothetical protein RW_GP092c [Caulobacter phage RW]WNV48123.1 hypothetical protein GB2A_gp091c [Caulobacter phage GB2A]
MAKTPTKPAKSPSMGEAIPMHKKLAVGQSPKTGCGDGPKGKC